MDVFMGMIIGGLTGLGILFVIFLATDWLDSRGEGR